MLQNPSVRGVWRSLQFTKIVLSFDRFYSSSANAHGLHKHRDCVHRRELVLDLRHESFASPACQLVVYHDFEVVVNAFGFHIQRSSCEFSLGADSLGM